MTPRFTVFVPGTVKNPLNGSWGYWPQHAHWEKTWRERTWVYLLQLRGVGRLGESGYGRDYDPRRPKHITLLAQLSKRRMNSHDNLRAALKPVVDGLVSAGVIHSDDDEVHVFEYLQLVNRTHARGVRITVAEQEAIDESSQTNDAARAARGRHPAAEQQPDARPGRAAETDHLQGIER